MFWAGKRTFVTGGTGFVGGHLVKKLVSLGANVKQFVHHHNPDIPDTCGYTGDLTCWTAHYEEFLHKFQPEIVFHLAAQPIVCIAMQKELDTIDINVKGTYNFLHVCRDIPSIKTFIHISTDKVYGKTEEISDNSMPVGVEHPYNASKLCGDILAQMYAHAFDMPITIIRNGNVYGPNDLHWDRLIPGTIRKIYGNFSPIMRGNALRDYIYVDDIVTGYLKVAELRYWKDGLETINLGSERPYHTFEIVYLLMKLMNRNDLFPLVDDMWKGELKNQHILEGKAKELIGWHPETSIEDGLKSTIVWYTQYLNFTSYLLKEKEYEQT